MLVDYEIEDIDPGKLLEFVYAHDPFSSYLTRMNIFYWIWPERVFEAGKADSVILDYLCEHYNGTTARMYEILIQAVGAHVETYDLEERSAGPDVVYRQLCPDGFGF